MDLGQVTSKHLKNRQTWSLWQVLLAPSAAVSSWFRINVALHPCPWMGNWEALVKTRAFFLVFLKGNYARISTWNKTWKNHFWVQWKLNWISASPSCSRYHRHIASQLLNNPSANWKLTKKTVYRKKYIFFEIVVFTGLWRNKSLTEYQIENKQTNLKIAFYF